MSHDFEGVKELSDLITSVSTSTTVNTEMSREGILERLIAFLYILLRDQLPAGVVEEIMRDHIDNIIDELPVKFSNKHLEAYAREIASRLLA